MEKWWLFKYHLNVENAPETRFLVNQLFNLTNHSPGITTASPRLDRVQDVFSTNKICDTFWEID